jgi:hypothetical protein
LAGPDAGELGIQTLHSKLLLVEDRAGSRCRLPATKRINPSTSSALAPM